MGRRRRRRWPRRSSPREVREAISTKPVYSSGFPFSCAHCARLRAQAAFSGLCSGGKGCTSVLALFMMFFGVRLDLLRYALALAIFLLLELLVRWALVPLDIDIKPK